ncbi:LOW QUALITY PROTEIN: uncharacterized protein LOC133835880 [Drosophila sulfurigaster albostrigata]|uniref:LOW QUALITY PROTEIN: uncharacterized protein LOC133835880 n=1 Tax=Drosophila sulfurigaster albostrigata TaxID=89887 RepID=UPI002D21991A|nr:LOW QUALITY PROTEIN: uncharacterized protein LOC133835880 [Drosophila sulfurigaster albostrigata]
MPIVARYRGATLGTTVFTFPQHFIDRIEIGMSDLMHADTCSLIRREQEIGIVELLCVLTIKCEEPQLDVFDEKSKCRNLGKNINPADVMFLFGEPQPCAKPEGPCYDELEPEEGDERLRLDLERYRELNQRVYVPPEDICGVDACCDLKNMTEQYGHVIDSLIRQMNTLNSPMPNDQCLFTDWSGKAAGFRPMNVNRTIPIPVGDWPDKSIKPIRFCPVCLTAMSWLPKYAPCPKCCTKPMPQFDEKPEEPPTADQIVQEYLKLPPKRVDPCLDPCRMDDDNEQEVVNENETDVRKRSVVKLGKELNKNGAADYCRNRCRCTCKAGKMCVHCRIRKLCADIFKQKDAEYKDCRVLEPNSNDDFCVVVEEDETQCRPYLERVFAELRDLYHKRDAAQQKLDARCTQSLFGRKRSEYMTSAAHKSSSSGTTLKAVGSPTFLHRAPQPKIGHKSCLKEPGKISRRHGWSWPSSKQARKYGWRPGAICRYAGAIMKFFLQYSPDQNAFNTCRRAEEQQQEKERRKPILNICKRNGAIFITLRAVNSANIDMKPIIFKIVKSDLARAMRMLKRKLKAKGYRKCTCHRPLMMCVCRKNIEKKELECELRKECKRLGMESCVDKITLSDTSDSEMEYNLDVSPPVALAKPNLLPIKPKTLNISTQTAAGDEQVTPKYPVKLDPYWRSYDCAAGDRYTGTAFGSPGEHVFEDGVFGFRGGGPHGQPAAPGGRLKPKTVWGSKPGGPMRGGGRDGTGGGGGGGGGGGSRGGSGKGGHGGGPGSGFGGFGGKSFPGAKKQPAGKSPPIPVRMTDRHNKAVAAAIKGEKDAVKAAIETKKKGINLIKYLEKKGALKKPWNPNEPEPEVKTTTKTTGPVLGKDGLTDAQRARRALLQVSIPPFDHLPRLGKGFDPCAACYSPFSYSCNYPCYNYC